MNRFKTLFFAAAFVVTVGVGLGVSFAAGVPQPVEKKLEHGFVQVYDFGAVKLHAYQTADLMADECFVIETEKGLVAIESPSFNPNIADWKKYTDALNKPMTDIFLSAHPAGGAWYGKAVSHATASAGHAITEGSTKALTDALGQGFGAEFNTAIPAIDATLKPGANVIGGIEFVVVDAGDSYDLAIPSINAVYTHMLGADTHSILAGPDHVKAVLASLESFKTQGYQLILSGHHTPEGPADVDAKIAYVERVRDLAAQSSGKADFIARVKAEYPDYLGLNYLGMTADYFFGE